jgi:hypothetical protein
VPSCTAPSEEVDSDDTFLLDTHAASPKDELGSAVAFSSDGHYLAVGAPGAIPLSGVTSYTGAVYLFGW